VRAKDRASTAESEKGQHSLIVITTLAAMSLPVLRVAVLLAVLTAPSPAMGQTRTSGGFIDFRYASHTSLTLFGGYQVTGAGDMLLVGMLQNPRTEYREIVAGVARPLGARPWSATIALAGAYASDGWYGQLYLFPALTLAPVAVGGVVLAYEPLEREGARSFT